MVHYTYSEIKICQIIALIVHFMYNGLVTITKTIKKILSWGYKWLRHSKGKKDVRLHKIGYNINKRK